MSVHERKNFLNYVGQTSDMPMMLEIERAEGIYLYNTEGKKFMDLIAGVSVSNVGHGNPKIIDAVKKQAEDYMHLMVYGEYVQSPEVELATYLAKMLPKPLQSTYYVNSGSEAIDGAMKLAKRYTGRSQIFSFKNAYHGGTHGALSLQSSDIYSLAFRPLLPQVYYLEYNNEAELEQITEQTACVIVEAVQAEAGVIPGQKAFMQKLRKKCTETGALLIFDEIQTGIGRTGKLFGFMHFDIVPDVITVAKAFGGGMPLGAFIAPKEIMDCLQNNPVLGHITTFGGHPVCCAAGLASLKFLVENKVFDSVEEKGSLFKQYLNHNLIKEVRGKGLLLAVDLGNPNLVKKALEIALYKGFISDWFLFNDTSLRIAPPLIITNEEIKEACHILLESLDEL